MIIAELLKADEGKNLEFKQDLSSPRNLLKTLVAFANSAGGRVVVGVADKTREPVGIDNPLAAPPSGSSFSMTVSRWKAWAFSCPA
ncbi:AlbA family DNA-binding domain-containing protein [Desulfurivibrio alkaliphilus]|uniref:AlbA family DNA-binding domain-containing protein n=1 Tax=Desulfurivibrio alkaliphilus TaxID=427923 RepID=UPI0001B40FAC|nr:ATP-binding protein [Desulfurivibrio alkaliphilus]